MQWWLICAIIGIVCILGYGAYWYILLPHFAPPSYHDWRDQTNTQIVIGSATLCARVAVSPTTQQKGLSGVSSLGPDSGMLFVFPKAGKFSFWMKGMLIPLDFIWMSNERIVDVTADVPPPQSMFDLHIIRPSQNADMVLEVPSGTISRIHAQIGDVVRIDAHHNDCNPAIVSATSSDSISP